MCLWSWGDAHNQLQNILSFGMFFSVVSENYENQLRFFNCFIDSYDGYQCFKMWTELAGLTIEVNLPISDLAYGLS